MDEREISVCCPTWNRFELTTHAFEKILDDERITEFIVRDDKSTDGSFEELTEFYKDNGKVTVSSNESNLNCYRNKAQSLDYISTDFAILIDSDNVIDKSYIDAIYAIPEWDENTFYTPSWAMPHFDFREFEGLTLSKENIAQYIHIPKIEVCLNAANYFVNQQTYLKCFDESVDPVTSDSIFMAVRLLEMGGKIHIVPNMHYEHRIHDGSHYRNNVSRTPKGFHQTLIDKLKNMS